MAQQTAVEWLQAEFNKWAEGRVFIPQDILEQAKAMEKEQISKAWDDGNYQYFCSVRTNEDFDNGYEYYEEQYKTE
jgi:hypothetical protein